jgi:anti-sigma factor RsiW
MLMDCKEIESYLHLFLDGEFDPRETAAVEEHLHSCDRCRGLVNAEINFQGALKARLNPPTALSEARRKRITDAAFGRAPRQRERASIFSWPGMLIPTGGLVAAAVAAVLLMPMIAPPEVDGFIKETVAAHESELPVEVSGTEEAILDYIRARTNFEPQPPIQHADAKLVGARLTRVGNQMAVIYRYNYKNEDVSVIQLPDDAASDDKVEAQMVKFAGERGGHGVTLFNHAGLRNAAVADMPSNELLRIVPASY